MSDRTFGVEIECGHHNGNGHVREELRKHSVPFASVGVDGSGVEVRTRVLKGKTGFKELKDTFKVLNEIGCYITNSDGQHVHFGALDFAGPENRADRDRLIESWVNVRPLVLPYVSPRRHSSYSCLDTWTTTVNRNLHKTVSNNGVGRGDLNLSNLNPRYPKCTIEVRLHEGNLDYDKAEAWVTFWIGLLDAIKSRKTNLPTYKRPDSLLRVAQVREEHKRKLKDAARHYARNSVA